MTLFNIEPYLKNLQSTLTSEHQYLIDILRWGDAYPDPNWKHWADKFGNRIDFCEFIKLHHTYTNIDKFENNDLHQFDSELSNYFIWKAQFQARKSLKNIKGEVFLSAIDQKVRTIISVNERNYALPVLSWDLRFLKKIYPLVKDNRNTFFRIRGISSPISCSLSRGKFIVN